MIVLALGSNLPGRFGSAGGALDAAKTALQSHGIKIIRSSRVFLTAPVPVSDQPWYHNAVVAVETTLAPHDLVTVLQKIENDMGRVRSERNAARIIDLDIIAYNNVVLEGDLIIPHPRLDARAFVLLPLRDVAPGWRNPRTQKSLDDLMAALPKDQIVTPLHFSAQPLYLMGILNVTPDSFSDGGRFFTAEKAIQHGKQLLEEGADILDIGGESTRPGAAPITLSEEQARILPVIEALKNNFISVDTRNAATMRAALAAGASMINDVTALTHDPKSIKILAQSDVPVCLMHMQGNPQTMQIDPRYDNAVEDIFAYLKARIAFCESAGIAKHRIVADPGFGFGKTLEHNLALLNNFERFKDLGVTLMAGVSRKRFIGQLAGDAPVDARLEGSLKAAQTLFEKGARIIRVHDVAATRRALMLV